LWASKLMNHKSVALAFDGSRAFLCVKAMPSTHSHLTLILLLRVTGGHDA
jgi:hypothetical protein